MKKIMIIFMLVSLTSCAQYRLHKGSYAKSLKKKSSKKGGGSEREDVGLRISTQVDDKLSSTHFGMINFIFENVSEEWIKIDKVYLKFNHPEINENVRFVSGDQLNYFLEAINDMNNEKELVAAQNRATWSAVAAGVAAASSSSQNSYSGVNVLGSMALGAAISMNISQYQNSKNVENEKLFPKGHLYHKNFVIPPGLYAKKWILLNTKNHERIGTLENAILTYITSKGVKETVEIEFDGYSDWQNDIGLISQLGTEEETEKKTIMRKRN